MRPIATKLHAQDSADEANSEKGKNEITIFVSNLSEDVWPFIEAMSDPKVHQNEIDENAGLSDLHLFSNADEHDLIFVSPIALDADLVAYFKDLFKFKNLQVVSPREHTGQTCIDFMNDADLIDTVMGLTEDYKKVTLLCYSATEQFYALKHKLLDLGLPIYTPECPDDEDAWTVNFFGSKSGIRQLGQIGKAEEPDFIMADGLICMGIYDAATIAAAKFIKNEGVVIKTNKGHSGAGVLIFNKGELPEEFYACEAKIREVLSRDGYWSQFPIIIEDLINPTTKVAGGYPNVEFKISKSGEIHFLYCCGLRVTDEGVFMGTEISDEVVNDRILARIKDLGYYIGEEYSKMGYRGYFDVDCIAGKNGTVYVTESNTRRTGVTFGYKIAKELIGSDFLSDSYIINENMKDMGPNFNFTYKQLLEFMGPLLYDPKTKEGILLPSASLLKIHKMAYMIFGKTKKQALTLEKKMFELLKKHN